MKCCRVLEMLSAYIDGDLNESSLKLVESHLAECAECSRELEYLKIMLGSAGEIEELQPPVGLKGGIMEAISETEQQCIPVMGMLSAYIDSQLPHKQQDLVNSHIKECKSCAEELAEMQEMVEAAGCITQIDPPISLRARIMAATTEKEVVTRVTFGQWLSGILSQRAFRWAGGSVAAALLAIGIISESSHTPTLVRQVRSEQESSNKISSKSTPAQTNGPTLLETAVNTQLRKNNAPDRVRNKYKANLGSSTVVAAKPAVKSASAKPTVKMTSIENIPEELSTDANDPVQLSAMEPTDTVSVADSNIDQEQAKRNMYDEMTKVAVANLENQENTQEWLKEVKNKAVSRKNGQNSGSVINVEF